jgi:hypothetical protein
VIYLRHCGHIGRGLWRGKARESRSTTGGCFVRPKTEDPLFRSSPILATSTCSSHSRQVGLHGIDFQSGGFGQLKSGSLRVLHIKCESVHYDGPHRPTGVSGSSGLKRIGGRRPGPRTWSGDEKLSYRGNSHDVSAPLLKPQSVNVGIGEADLVPDQIDIFPCGSLLLSRCFTPDPIHS